MKRAETFWQVIVLLLVLTMTLGIYSVLGVMLVRPETTSPPVASTQPPEPGPAVQIVEPMDGAVVQRSEKVSVRAAFMEPGFVQAELQVDGRVVSIEVNPKPLAVPGTIEWTWTGAGEGPHKLIVRAHKADGQIGTSPPTSVTVVPEGSLVFASNRDGAYAIYAMETDGGDPVRLTAGPRDSHQPAPRIDGSLAYVSEAGAGQSVIRQLDTGQAQGVDLFPGVDPAWADDGLRLAYAADLEGVSQVFSATVGQGDSKVLTTEEAYAGQPTWSPEGKSLAYVAEREGNWDIWVISLEDGSPQRLTADPAMDWAPAWSPDGSRLAFVSNREGNHQVYVMAADGTGVRRLTDLARGAESPAWSPDGFWLAFVAYTGQGAGINTREIHLIRVDGQSPVRLTYNSFDDTEVQWALGP